MIFFRLNLSKRIDFLKQNISLRFKSSVIRISEKQTSTKILKSWRLYYGNYLKHFAKVLSHHKWSVSVKVVVSSSVKTVVCGLPHKMLKNLRLLESPRHFHRWATLSSRTRKKDCKSSHKVYAERDIKVFCLCSILLDFFTLLKIFCPGLKMKIEKPWLKWKLFFCEFISYVIIKLYVVYFTAPTLLKTAHTTRKRSMLDIILKLPNPVRSS